MTESFWRVAFYTLVGVAIFAFAGCAQVSGLQRLSSEPAQWSGRLSVKVYSTPPEAFTADFELTGNPQTGSMTLFSPIGTTAAVLQWSPGHASFTSGGQTQQFDSVEALALQATGTALPIGTFFDWLQGRSTELPGWSVRAYDTRTGRVQATRELEGQPRVELRIALLP
jgi:outer membrane lipoprotein LolB